MTMVVMVNTVLVLSCMVSVLVFVSPNPKSGPRVVNKRELSKCMAKMSECGDNANEGLKKLEDIKDTKELNKLCCDVVKTRKCMFRLAEKLCTEEEQQILSVVLEPLPECDDHYSKDCLK